jgi:hypothetical protein
MYSRNAARLFACAALLGGASLAEQVHAQNAPFTIRRPPDGATVREKVNVEIPRASIGPGGFVAIYVDDKFTVAVPPDEKGMRRPFEFTWDTKSENISDGPHTIRFVLYEPAGGGAGTAVAEKSATSVRLNVANIIHNGPSTLHLRYKLPEGQNLEYSRVSTAKITNSGISIGNTNDTLLAQTDSKLLLDIVNPTPLALVRNKLTSLSILQSGQETTLDKDQLSASMYQEMDPLGEVHYETGSGVGIDEFMAQGLPVNNTLELPLLPNSPVAIGTSWSTPRQRLDIPGVPPALQPRVTLTNKLVDLEWEDGYPTAKIHQTYDGSNLPSEIQFGPIPVTSPQVKFERDIYFAYNAGRLIRTTRTITITGRTTVQTDTAQPGPGAGYNGAPGMMGGGAGMAGMMGGGKAGMMGPGMMSGGGSGMGGMMQGRGMAGGSGMGGMMQGRGMAGGSGMGGMMQGRGMMPGGPGMGGMMQGRGMMPGGPGMGSGMPPGMMGSGGPGMGAMMGRRGMNIGGSALGSGRSGIGAMGGQEADHPVTLKAVTETQLIKVIAP